MNDEELLKFVEMLEVPDLGLLDYDPSLLPDPSQDWSDHEQNTDPDPELELQALGLAASPIRWVRGKRACNCIERTVAIIERELCKLGAIKQDLSGLITQGSYNTSVAASAGTHSGGGVWDVKWNLVNTDAKKRAWLAGGAIPFERTRADANWSPHGHIVWAGCPHLAASAARQVTAARNGRNALRNNARFRGLGGNPTIITWQEALKREVKRTPTIEEELDNMKPETRAEIKKIVEEVVVREKWAPVGNKKSGAYWGSSLGNQAGHAAAHSQALRGEVGAVRNEVAALRDDLAKLAKLVAERADGEA